MVTAPVLEGELERLIGAGVDDARARGERFTTLHLLLALLPSRTVRAALASAGGSAKVIRAAAIRQLERAADGAEAEVATAAGAEAAAAEQVLVQALGRVRAGGGARLAAADVLVQLAQRSGCAAAALLATHQLALSTIDVHGSDRRTGPVALWAGRLARRLRSSAPSAVRPGADEPVRVVIHDDSFTTRVFVVESLARHFGMTRERAEALTEQVQVSGLGLVGELPYAEAIRCVDAITAAARCRGFPLRVVVDAQRSELPAAVLRRRSPSR